ncbi:ABC transporter permease [Devosia nitrariae]|nr:ABC transporter permease [Devosia nitrariae]
MLDRKLIRDLLRMWLQVLAIAMVMACGVATIIIAVGALRTLEDTRDAFYDRYRFGTVFASLVRAPLHLREQLARIPGINGVETRIARAVLLDVPGMREPATGLAVSIPDIGELSVNSLYIRAGRLPDPDRVGEVAVNEQFAKAHRMVPGSTFEGVINGSKRLLTVTGIVLSPEYVYTLGPGDLVPDQRRFGVMFMPRRQLAGMFDMTGAFNDLTLRTQRGADLAAVISAVDTILAPYGGTGARDRDDQISHAFLDSELSQLRGMVTIVPPIFLFVAAFLVNMILSRLITLEREQVGLLKALGFSALAVAWHYAKLVIVVALLGTAIGGAVGAWVAPMLAQVYGEFYYFPFLVLRPAPDLYLTAATVTSLAALAGAGKALWNVLSLPAAVAMQPPAPTRYRKLFHRPADAHRFFSQLTTMALRGMIRHPVRSLLTTFSTAISLSLIVTALFTFDSIEAMIDIIYFRTERQDATLAFGQEQSPAVLQSVGRLPGVLRAEPMRSVPVVLRNEHVERRLTVSAWTEGADLSQILATDLTPVQPAPTGLMISDRVASILGLSIGDLAEVELLEKEGRIEWVPVTGVFQSYIGMSVFMSDEALTRLVGDGPRVTGARLAVDAAQVDDLYDVLKSTPAIAAISLMTVSRERFREQVAQNVTMMTWIYSGLAIIITFGVIYNTARIQLSERARELASLRVLGFTRGEVYRVLLVELAVVALAAQPVGWGLGYLFCWAVVEGFDTDLFRIPFVIEQSTFGIGSGLVLAVVVVTGLVIRRRVARLDLISVLKTRE